MIFFDDTAKGLLRPKWLDGKEVASAREAINTYLSLSDAERRQTDLPPVWKMTFSSDVIVALATWSGQRCAFCEQRREDIAPYRFRPPGYAQPLSARNGKDSYLALAFAWSNLFPICEECRPEKLSHFPVSGGRARFKQVVDPGLELNEDATLFYPGERGITRSLKMTGAGLYIPAGPRARLTVEHFRLNREQLVAARSHNLATFIETIDPHVRPARWLELFSTDEFGSARYLYLRRLMRLIADIHGLPALRGLEPPRLQEALIRWNSRIDLRTAVFQAADTLRHDDSALERDSRRDADAGESSGQPRPDGPSHRIKAVHIETFKSLEDIAFELPAHLPVAEVAGETNAELLRPEAPCLLILGENATGKSSILEAIALACLSTLDIDVMELDADDFTLNPKYMGSDQAEDVHDSRVRVEFHDGSQRTLEINSRPGTRFPFRQVASSGEAPPVFAYGARRLYGAAARRGERRHHDTLFLNDRNLSNPEAWLRSLYVKDEDALDEVVSALRHIIQIDGSFETIAFPAEDPDGGGVIRIRKMLPDDKSFVVPQPLKVVSSGYRAILALVCDVLEGLFELYDGDARAARRAPALILIDEIEAHLHPRWKLNIVAGLRQALPKATFIFTSHDPLCLRGMHNGEVMALNRYHNVGGDGRELPERVERVSGFENVESMTIEQLLTSDLFQLLSTDDRQTEIDYARMADILASEKAGAVAPGDAAVLKKFRAEIADALPYGRGEIPMLVQEAVAEFLRDRRLLDADSASAARVRAKEQIKKHLRGLLG